ncbi:MAG TPA: branched-chain amino acid ABC transporter permease [Chloroflexota bacterium]|nr:branched-chain amino acid ABC transporter permease [Chloroflexota bacterium]
MNETLILTQILTGIVGGLVFALLALGLNLIFGFMGVVNFAHGSFYMVGAYVGLVVVGRLGAGFWPALVIVPIVVGLLGAVVERTLIRPLYTRKEYEPLLLTFGLAFVLIEIVKFFFGKFGLAFNAPAGLNDALISGTFFFPKYQVFLALAAVAIIAALWLVLEKTDIGLIIRAGTQDSIMIRALGIDFDRTRALVFAIGIGLAGLAGVLHAPTRELSADMGLLMTIFAFVTVVVGGMGSYWGAVVGGLLIGIVYSLVSLFAQQFAQVAVFALMALILLVRPRGLLGTA